MPVRSLIKIICPECDSFSLPATDTLVTVRGEGFVVQAICPTCTDVLTKGIERALAERIINLGGVNYTSPELRCHAPQWLDSMAQMPQFVAALDSPDAMARFVEHHG